MSKLNIPVGISDFGKIRENNYYYVDKTGLISELLLEEPNEVTLITRPRRFGKTLGLSMLSYFFDVRKNSSMLFQGLAIARNTALCRKWMNQYPTIFFSLKDIDGLSFSTAYSQLCVQIANLYKEYSFLMESTKVDEDDKKIFEKLKAGEADQAQVSRALNTLMRMLWNYYEKPVILLLDEYDVPAAKASSYGYYVQMMEVLRILMSTALKDNPMLKFAVVSGCLKIAKESIFTGTNNFISDSIADSRLDEFFGFTQQDVNQILVETERTDLTGKIRMWYDGYQFGMVDVYCPWDVMNYIWDVQRNPDAVPVSYWKNTSDNAIIRSFIEYAGGSITKKLETLLAGGKIAEKIDENLTYDYLHSSEENLWSVLYLTGYLTSVREEEQKEGVPEGKIFLKIPNAEIHEIFETTIQTWFQDSAKTWNRSTLFQAVWDGNCEKMTQEMNRMLRKTISYHDYREDFYHAFLAGIFTGAGYHVESNREHGEGRSDVVVYNENNGCVAVFEAKYVKKLEEMENGCEKALKQIDARMYTKEYEEEYDKIQCYGICFFKKRCLIKKAIEN